MKKLISLALAGGMVLSLAACGSSASTAASTATESTSTAESTAESTASEGKQLKIAFFMYENSNTFTTYIRKGLENYGAENNVVVDSFDGKSDQSTQTDAITPLTPAQARRSTTSAASMTSPSSTRTALPTWSAASWTTTSRLTTLA